jgi:diadenosine tetraphosphate (Ap4A) HIT family hydrolase
MTFTLHPQLAQDTIALGRFKLCHLRLMNECHYPWFILIPEGNNLQEIHQLNPNDRLQFIHESCYLAEHLQQHFKADKLNIAAIGNKVPQLHIHHVVRFQSDRAWPNPVWGQFEPEPYSESALSTVLNYTHTLVSNYNA